MTVLAVPRSTAMSRPVSEEKRLSDMADPVVVVLARRRLLNLSSYPSHPFQPPHHHPLRRLRHCYLGWLNLGTGEPERDLALGGLVSVACVYQVLGGDSRKLPPDRTGLRVLDLGRPH